MLCVFWPLPSFAQADWLPPKYAHCEPYYDVATRAVERRWARDFQYPAVLRGLMAQESGCRTDAISHAGAKGLMQFMDGTAHWVGGLLGIDFDPYDTAQAIDASAYYLWKQCSMYRRRDRSPLQACEMGLGNYNYGAGNMLRAQNRCNNGRLFVEVVPCLPKETADYVPHIRRRTLEMEAARPWNVPPGWRPPVDLSSLPIACEARALVCVEVQLIAADTLANGQPLFVPVCAKYKRPGPGFKPVRRCDAI